ncbi:MAG: winged helix-turn-helix domain-containing protein, partial [Chloroflexota bacterium]
MANPDIIRVGNLNIDTASYRLHKDETPVKLTPTEWALLKELVQHPNQVLTHRTLLRRVWGDEYSTENDYVHTYISRLRRK